MKRKLIKCKYCGEDVFKSIWNGEECIRQFEDEDRSTTKMHTCSLWRKNFV